MAGSAGMALAVQHDGNLHGGAAGGHDQRWYWSSHAGASPDRLAGSLTQVSLETLMVGNLDEKSLVLAAIDSATLRATAL